MQVNEERLRRALKTLAANETRVPPPSLEIMLAGKVQPQKTTWLWPAVAAALATAGLIALVSNSHPPQKLAKPSEPPPTLARVNATPAPLRIASPARKRPRKATPPIHATAPLMRIPYSEPLSGSDRVELVRVTMPGAQLLAWGFPISGRDPNDNVSADLLVGEDGLARAVRLVR